ncbi:hypothetical protein HYC85_020832 [Camellia sinensis]|uniref:Niemann-Pick C1 N-terminal domain-containing protein n=1 Tax=Camellia sinensis TaxID=4442 RepID=A0A7J7GR91_CAMSI|nr:hypothetical protein HYC85_020832 [Camellia sinensis]
MASELRLMRGLEFKSFLWHFIFYPQWFAFVGRKVGLTVPGSPYLIDFQPTAPESSGMRLMNVTTYSCGDTSLGCSCGDCPAAPVCSNSAPPSSVKKGSCSVRIGSLKAKCIDFAVAIVYIILVSVFLGWGFFHRKVERSPAYRTRHVLNVANNREKYSANQQKDENPSIQMLEDVSQTTKGVQLSVVQGYMSKFYRRYGTMVARNPVLVLCSSLAVVLLLCLGLIHFKVETRPEKNVIFTTLGLTEAKHCVKVDGIQANYSGSLVSLSDICLKPLGQDCATQSVLQYFKMDPTNYDGYGGVQHVEYCFQASAFIITYPVNNAIDKEGNEKRSGPGPSYHKYPIELGALISRMNSCQWCSLKI